MTTRVKTLYLSSFNMPRMCVSCGTIAESGQKWKVHWGDLDKDKINLSVDFPLCETCGGNRKLQRKRSSRFVFLLFVLLSLFLCRLTSVGINNAVNGKGFLGIAAGLVVMALVVLLGSWLSDLIDTAGLTP